MRPCLLLLFLLPAWISVLADTAAPSDATSEANPGGGGTVDGAPTVGGVFRGIYWGMTREQVKRTEEGQPAEEDDVSLFYEAHLETFPCLVFYLFTDERLHRSGYMFTQVHDDPNGHVADYGVVKSLLCKQYGAPDLDEIVWMDPSRGCEPVGFGTAVSRGELMFTTVWDIGDTRIEMLLSGSDSRVRMAIVCRQRR